MVLRPEYSTWAGMIVTQYGRLPGGGVPSCSGAAASIPGTPPARLALPFCSSAATTALRTSRLQSLPPLPQVSPPPPPPPPSLRDGCNPDRCCAINPTLGLLDLGPHLLASEQCLPCLVRMVLQLVLNCLQAPIRQNAGTSSPNGLVCSCVGN